jgi:DNA-binding NarL/FixJ family response regulator
MARVSVVVGVDGSGRSHRLGALASTLTGPVVRLSAHSTLDEVTEQLTSARAGRRPVLVDDADRLPDTVLDLLADAARHGVPMVIARRPTLDRPALAALDEAVAATGTVEVLAPLDGGQVAEILAAAGAAASPTAAEAVRVASAGLPAVVVALAGAPQGTAAPGLVARVQQRLAVWDPPVAELARVLALGLDLPDRALAAVTGMDTGALGTAVRTLYDHGMLLPGSERMIPAVAQAVLADLPAAARRRLHDLAARALIEDGADPVTTAQQLSTARVHIGPAADIYRRAGDTVRFTDPMNALRWYDDAVEAGSDPATVAAGRAEAAALVGKPIDVDAPTGAAEDAARLSLAAGAVAAHRGRAVRAADTLLATTAPGPALAVPSLLATGRWDDARTAADGDGPTAVRRLAHAALAVTTPTAALPLLIEAAEEMEAHPPQVVLPDTPHALGALVAVAAGDLATALHLLDRAVTGGVGGPALADRHRILRGWAEMRAGQYETAMSELARCDGMPLAGRERLLVAALSAGMARRSGDISRLRAAWADAEPVLARQVVDLFHLEPLEELLVAGARLRQQHRIQPVWAALDNIVERLDRPAAWQVSVSWIALQMAVVGDDAAAAAEAVRKLAAVTPEDARQRARCAAADQWARTLAGAVDPAAVVVSADALAAAELPWEASRLTGDAAIRTGDPATARRLLERARELASAEPASTPVRGDPRYRGLSEREIEVARLVLAGRTHREIGAQLYLSPKTVEHHVARIRTKLGASSRAELLAALRPLQDTEQSG